MKTMRESVDHVRVCCRVRPLNSSERRLHGDACVSFPDQSCDVVDCLVGPSAGSGNGGGASDSAVVPPGRHSFSFSHVFRPEAGQADVYEHVARPIVADVMCGYNGTIFMYGQTGSGKTHTMFGDVNGGAWGTRDGGGNAPGRSSPDAAVVCAVEDDEEAVAGQRRVPESAVYLRCADEDVDGGGGAGESSARSSCVDRIPMRAQLMEAEDEEQRHHQQQQQQRQAPPPSARVGPGMVRPLKSQRSKLNAGAPLAKATHAAPRLAAPSPPPSPASSTTTAASSSFCRSSAAVTPLGALDHVNRLQNTRLSKVGVEGHTAAEATSAVPAWRHTPRHARETRAVFAGDAVSGVIPRAVHDVFAAIAAADASTEFDVQMFFVEVYMEQIRDLLASHYTTASAAAATTAVDGVAGPRRLQLREDVSSNSFYVDGCRNPHVSCASEVLRLVRQGLKQRATSATAMNETSSRSHCLLNLTVKSVNRAQGVSTVGKLYLVDLAGSEKVGKTNAKGLRLEEAKLINKSLSTLGMVILSLTDQKATHTPYRDSVLTKILKDSLGGNSHTALVICCSPSPYNAQETLSTLRFGARAKAIENKAVVNRELTAAQLRRMLETAKEEIERLHAKVQQLSTGSSGASSSSGGGMAGTPEYPVSASRKLAGAATATAAPSLSLAAASQPDTSRISELLEERVAEQARLQHLRAEAAQLQDSLNSAQDIISALQEERDGYVDKVQSLHDEVEAWEDAHTAATKRAATQEALLQQSAVLLRAQASEVRDLIQRMSSYAAPLQQARDAVDQLHGCVFGRGTSQGRRRTRLTAESCHADALAAAAAAVAAARGLEAEAMAGGAEVGGRLSTGSATLPDGESPNPRPHLCEPMREGRCSGSVRQQQQQQHPSSSPPSLPTAHRHDRRASSVSVSPGMAAAQEWLSRAASVGGHDEHAASHMGSSRGGGGGSATPAVQGECVRRLEEQLAAVAADHTALQRQHKELLAELQLKQHVLLLRGSRLDALRAQLECEQTANKEMEESKRQEQAELRGSLEAARNDANYWRRRYEELANLREQPRASGCPRGSVRFVVAPVPPPPQQHQQQQQQQPCDDVHGGVAGAARSSAAALLASRPRLSLTGASSGLPSSRASGEDVLLSLSSESTPLRSSTAQLTTDP